MASQVRTFTAEEYAAFLAALPVSPYVGGTYTNASVNRDMACDAAKHHGMNAAQICAKWPEVWCLVDGKLAQIYDYRLRGTDPVRYESNRTICRDSLRGPK